MKQPQTIVLSLALVIIACAALACSKSGDNSTPTKAFEAFFNAVKGKDVVTLKKLIQKKELDEIESEAKKKGKSLDDFLKAEVIEQMARKSPEKLPETRNEKIDGENATLEFKDEENWRTVRFRKEDGGWKINI